ncbi:MAG: RIP metalloprotease RseP [Parcubacteria bacterium C7867-005]|nr:MAG: RIP metalloprotease RseP [Parcubacteria bacterium C7867-005]
MSVIYFLIILSALVIVHELGHFLVARYFGIRVDEFGLGYPPKAKSLFSWKGTLFTLNWLPFGGFVKIFGENPNESIEGFQSVSPDSFSAKHRGAQASVLVAGVVGNILFAWLLISIGFMSGLPVPSSMALPMTDARTMITTVMPDSPAHIAGLLPGDSIVELRRGKTFAENSPEKISEFIGLSGEALDFTIKRGEATLVKTLSPSDSVVSGRLVVGISMDTIGTVRLSPPRAVYEGLKATAQLTALTATGLADFIFGALRGEAKLSDVTGPVGLVGMVGDVKALGFVYVMYFTALISINLALVNLLPIPALDGGRLLFVGIESIIRRPISPKVFNMANNVGFFLLITLMLLITFRDITKLI